MAGFNYTGTTVNQKAIDPRLIEQASNTFGLNKAFDRLERYRKEDIAAKRLAMLDQRYEDNLKYQRGRDKVADDRATEIYNKQVETDRQDAEARRFIAKDYGSEFDLNQANASGRQFIKPTFNDKGTEISAIEAMSLTPGESPDEETRKLDLQEIFSNRFDKWSEKDRGLMQYDKSMMAMKNFEQSPFAAKYALDNITQKANTEALHAKSLSDKELQLAELQAKKELYSSLARSSGATGQDDASKDYTALEKIKSSDDVKSIYRTEDGKQDGEKFTSINRTIDYLAAQGYSPGDISRAIQYAKSKGVSWKYNPFSSDSIDGGDMQSWLKKNANPNIADYSRRAVKGSSQTSKQARSELIAAGEIGAGIAALKGSIDQDKQFIRDSQRGYTDKELSNFSNTGYNENAGRKRFVNPANYGGTNATQTGTTGGAVKSKDTTTSGSESVDKGVDTESPSTTSSNEAIEYFTPKKNEHEALKMARLFAKDNNKFATMLNKLNETDQQRIVDVMRKSPDGTFGTTMRSETQQLNTELTELYDNRESNTFGSKIASAITFGDGRITNRMTEKETLKGLRIVKKMGYSKDLQGIRDAKAALEASNTTSPYGNANDTSIQALSDLEYQFGMSENSRNVFKEDTKYQADTKQHNKDNAINSVMIATLSSLPVGKTIATIGNKLFPAGKYGSNLVAKIQYKLANMVSMKQMGRVTGSTKEVSFAMKKSFNEIFEEMGKKSGKQILDKAKIALAKANKAKGLTSSSKPVALSKKEIREAYIAEGKKRISREELEVLKSTARHIKTTKNKMFNDNYRKSRNKAGGKVEETIDDFMDSL